MTKFIVASIVVAALLIVALLGLLRGRRSPIASPDVLDRVKKRNRELEARERSEDED
jgi:Flp pilus assembly protein protease CpaA